MIGGDHSINIPCINAFKTNAAKMALFMLSRLMLIWTLLMSGTALLLDMGTRCGVQLRKTMFQGWTQLGIRNVSSTAKEGYEDARARGSDILSVRQVRKLGTDGVLARIPEGARYYVTIDIDAFCPSIAPGTGTPSHGGFAYYDVMEILQGLTKRGNVVGVDLVEVAPAYDPTEITQILAAQLLMNFIGFIFHER